MVGQLLPASILPGLLEITPRGRLDAQALFERAGVDAEIVGRADRYVTLGQLDTLLGSAFAQGGDPLSGLRAGRDNHHRKLALLGGLMAASADLEQALSLLLRYKDLAVPYLTLELRREEHHCALIVSGGDMLGFTHTRVHNDLVVATMAAIGRSLLGGRMPIQRVAFRHPCPSRNELAEYRTFFRCALDFAQPANALVFSPALLGQSLPGARPNYQRRLQRTAERGLLALRRARGVTGQVRERLRSGLGQGPLSVERIAAQLDMTSRTLQRRLREEGVRFAGLRDEVRMEYACQQLRGGDCDMAELSRRLGFSDTANFYHAFRRWTGCAPGEYRRRSQAPV